MLTYIYIYAKFYIVRKALLCKRDIYSKFLNKKFLNAINFLLLLLLLLLRKMKKMAIKSSDRYFLDIIFFDLN